MSVRKISEAWEIDGDTSRRLFRTETAAYLAQAAEALHDVLNDSESVDYLLEHATLIRKILRPLDATEKGA